MVIESFKSKFSQAGRRVNDILRSLFSEQSGIDGHLREAMEYTLLGEGKRIRPVLILWCCEVVAGEINRDAEIAAATVEMVCYAHS